MYASQDSPILPTYCQIVSIRILFNFHLETVSSASTCIIMKTYTGSTTV